MNKAYPIVLGLCIAFLILGIVIAKSYGETIGTDSKQDRDKIFNKLQLPKSSDTNYFFSIIITPTGVKETNVVLDSLNYTALKNNVAFFTACGGFDNGKCQPPALTTQKPTMNYCPLAKEILLNQDTYISKLYNQTSGLDLTDYVYPSYCYVETGKNPINGQGSDPIPSPNLSITTDKTTYHLGDKIIISGKSPNQVPDIGIVIRAPNGNVVSIDQTTAIGGTFTDSFQTGGSLWNQTGIFTIKAVQGEDTSIATFTMASSVPEFPFVAPLIMAIIFSVLVISRRITKI